jgi:hypothetical protein
MTAKNITNSTLDGVIVAGAAAADQELVATSSTAAAWSYPNPAKARIASQAAGDVLYADTTTTWARLGKGADGTVLTLASGVPSWAAAGGGSSAPQFRIAPGYDESYWDTDSGTAVHSHNSKGYHHGAAQGATPYGKLGWLTNGNLPSGAMKNMTGYVLGCIENPGGTAYGTYYLKFFSEGASSSFNGVTVNHIGLKFDTSTGPTSTNSSTVGNGTSGTTTTLASINMLTTDHLLTFKQPTVAAGDVTFYVDGVSKNVHSTNQPTFAANSQFLGYYVAGGTGSGNFTLNFREMAIQGDMY